MTRYIDADVLHTELVKMNAYGYLTAKKAIRRLEQSPTVDAVPVRHGKWLRSQEDGCFRCSDCGMPSINYQNYCCRCGADMREVNEE